MRVPAADGSMLTMSRQELETPKVSPYGWLITHDELTADNDSDDVHTTGPSRISEQVEEALHKDVTPHGFGRAEFRMYDDDGIPYYRGRMFYREELEGTEVQIFAPTGLWPAARRMYADPME